MLKRWITRSSEILYRNPWWTYKKDAFEIPGGVTGEYHYVHTHGASMVVPVLDTGDVVLVRQYRYLCDRESLEFPAGGVKEGHTYEQTARQELAEETGYVARILTQVGAFNPYNGVTTEICGVFLAGGLAEGNPCPDPMEEFERIICAPARLDDLIAGGVIWDGMTLAAWMLVRPHLASFLNDGTLPKMPRP